MRIVADENIPLVNHYFGSYGEVILKPGRDICHTDVIKADILLVRSVTQVNKALLHNTSVKFVGSTTIGADHLDTIWLNEAGIRWAVARGCNSSAVVNYVICAIAALQKNHLLPVKKLRAGVIGVGAIGSEVALKLKALDWDVIWYDPFRSASERSFSGVYFDELTDLDFITLHTPLTYEGTYPTFHLIEKNFLQRQKQNAVLLNTGRGAVVNFEDLKKYGQHLQWCLDVWENEPHIDLEVLSKAVIATPHIAGYSVQGKYRGIKMIYDAALQQRVIPKNDLAAIEYPHYPLSLSGEKVDWRDIALKIYDPRETTVEMKKVLSQNPEAFDELRKNFPPRHEFEYVELSHILLNAAESLAFVRRFLK